MNAKQERTERTARTGGQNTRFIIMAVILGLLIVVSGIQAVELVNLKKDLGEGKLVASSGSIGTTVQGGTLEQNTNALPTMVGGC